MELLPYVVAYVAIGIFLVTVVARFMMWTRMPLHVRWELYPVAHEGRRAHYGGSYLEETDWWKKPREKSLAGELKVMVPEILFLVALKEHNPKLWLRSYPFHLGIYLVIGATVLMLGTSLLGVISPALVAGTFGDLLRWAVIACGVIGLALGIIGALGLLYRRLTAEELRDFTSPVDIFNLAFFVITFGVAFASFALVDRDFGRAGFFVHQLLTLKMAPLPGSGPEALLPTASIVLLSLLAAYIPLTHMSHFIGKFFAYHAIRWNDEPNLRGGAEEGAIQQVLGYKVSWAAAHIRGEGKKSWVDVATEEVKK